jgi:PAS domain S-box-containing protein
LLAAEREQRLLAETLREVTLVLTSQTSHAAVLDEILRQAQRVVPHSASDISLLQDDVLRIVRWQGYEKFGSESFLSGVTQPLADFPLPAEVVQSRTPLVIPDTHQEPRWVVLEETSWIRAHIEVPICLRNRVLGLLQLNADTPGEFSAQDVKRLQPLVNAAAIAIEKARLVEGLESEVAARTAEIRAEQEKSETILRNIGDAIAVTDLERRIQYVNAAFTRLTGYPAEAVVGRYPNFLIAERMPESDWQSVLVALAQGEEWQGEITIRRQDGRSYDAAVTTAPVRDAEGQLVGFVSSHQDISQRKQLGRARRRFMTNVSHELRTPVTNIKLYASLLQKRVSAEKTDRYLRVLDEQADRLSHLVQDILEMTALDGGRAPAAWETVDPADLIRTMVTRYASRAQAAGLSLVARPVPAGLPAAKGDPSRLFQALEEIVENAIRFTPADGQVTLDAGSILHDAQHWVTVSVHDTGPGISPEEQERVFDRFFRGSLAESGHIPGTGLGLSIAQEIMQAHGGRVTVESRGVPGQGCTFILWLPSAPDNRPTGE